MTHHVIEIVIAYILDLILGDPIWLPHPVKGIGWLIRKLEKPLRKLFAGERIAGMALVILVVGIVWCLSFVVIDTVASFNKYLGSLVSILFIYTALSVKDLAVEAKRVYHALEAEDTHLARKNLGLIVGRDTHNLDRRDIIRATVETVSENIVDGIISPIFYAFLGGAPLALAYKAVNTLDSMVGYKNERYKNLGWASARIDDLVNFIPARLAGLFLPIASALAGKNGVNSWKVFRRDGRKNPSPNSGIPEAAVAGALGIQLGGLNYYNSKAFLKPVIGNDISLLKRGHIKESIRISYFCSLVVIVLGIILVVIIRKGW